MPETIISPRVKTREVDRSFIPPIPEQRTALVIGATEKGNFFTPETITLQNIDAKIGVSNFENMKEYTSFTAQNFLRGGADTVKVLPVTAISAGEMGESHTLEATIATVSYEFLQIFPTDSTVALPVTVDVANNTLSNLTLSVDSVEVLSGADFTDPQVVRNFYEKHKNPTSGTFFVKSIFDVAEIATQKGVADADVDSAVVTSSASTGTISTVDATEGGVGLSKSPKVVSQNNEELFQFFGLSRSDIANRSFRIRIANITKGSERADDSPFARFTVEVYTYSSNNLIGDNTRKRFEQERLVESFSVSLDPQSEDYIEKVIGNRYEFYNSQTGIVDFNGIYANQSQFVRVEMAEGGIGSDALPWGFKDYKTSLSFFGSADVTAYQEPSATLDGGIDFSHPFVDFLHVEELSNSVVTMGAYSLGDVATLDENNRKFTFGMFGGTKGLPDNTPILMGEDMTPSNSFGYDFEVTGEVDGNGLEAFKHAIDIVADKEYIDFDVLFLAGINMIQHQAVVSYAIDMLEQRQDAVLFVDAGTPKSTVNEVIGITNEFDSSYASAFAPWLLTSQNALVPASSAFANAIAVNDRNYKPWYSLIGIERGQVTGVSDVTKRFKLATRDKLVANNVNPIAKYKGNILIFGSETLQQRDTLLGKYPIRRLLIESKRRISDVADFYIGKQYTDQVIASLNDEISQELDQIKDENGLIDFRVEFEQSADLVDRGIVNGRIILQPTTAIQGIVFTFEVTNTGVNFDF